MICKNIYVLKKFCRDDLSNIKNYEQAINDTENVWDCHHINELTYTKKELIKMNMYYHRPANEFIFLTRSEHNLLHTRVCAGSKEIKIKEIDSIFGKKYFEHFGYSARKNLNQYKLEHLWYKRHGKCRWE